MLLLQCTMCSVKILHEKSMLFDFAVASRTFPFQSIMIFFSKATDLMYTCIASSAMVLYFHVVFVCIQLGGFSWLGCQRSFILR